MSMVTREGKLHFKHEFFTSLQSQYDVYREYLWLKLDGMHLNISAEYECSNMDCILT